MNKINYNEKEEAYEITYKIWDFDVTVRFYVDDQQEIMDNFSDIAQKLDKVNRNRKKIADILARDRRFNDGYMSDESLEEHIAVESAYFDIDEDGTVMCFTIKSHDEFFLDKFGFEIGTDDGIEVTGIV